MQGIMKNILLTGLAAASLLLSGCQDKLEEDFYNPENYQAPEDKLAAGLFTKTLYEWQVYVQDYGEWWWSLTGAGVTAYAQVGVRPTTQNYAGIYQDFEDVTTGNGFSADNGIRNYFNNMYTKMKTWSIFKQLVEEEYTGETLTNSYVYYQLTTVMKDYTMLRNIDFFNSIPYYNAIQGNKGILFAEYDDPLEVTKTILDELKEISESIVADYDKMSPDAKATFAKQRCLPLKETFQLWKQYYQCIEIEICSPHVCCRRSLRKNSDCISDTGRTSHQRYDLAFAYQSGQRFTGRRYYQPWMVRTLYFVIHPQCDSGKNEP